MDDDDYAFDDYPSKCCLQLIYTTHPPTESTVLTSMSKTIPLLPFPLVCLVWAGILLSLTTGVMSWAVITTGTALPVFATISHPFPLLWGRAILCPLLMVRLPPI